ncbi:hypothetical protein MCOR25_003389 [Pyricularia grisea]|uniref:HhH-GPD domain-containing protein n=1 Tax=Pyricularia grisea TaxID=148305 RepID=A0A6P8BAI7_PYRGI|nr:uncharacterized protein PgNI_03130 [Pyricularia grisea]KAI6373761.1 hypothetical protein MCOR25_003389 [Pyricularia grisea]TLD12697.1 hypothetical protein PgNI_03130 [Pyricularia grisea]
MGSEKQQGRPRTFSRPTHITHDAARSLLNGFNVNDDETLDFLAGLVASGTACSEVVDDLYEAGLMAPAEDWDFMLQCAASHVQLHNEKETRDRYTTSSEAMLSCLNSLLGYSSFESLELTYPSDVKESESRPPSHPVKQSRRRSPVKSPFWLDGCSNPGTLPQSQSRVKKPLVATAPGEKLQPKALPQNNPSESRTQIQQHSGTAKAPTLPPPAPAPSKAPLKAKSGLTSGYFDDSPPRSSPGKRGVAISGLPFPPLTSPKFGLIQEELAHSPFELLIAVRLLIKTAGKAAIPTFRRLVARYPTPEAFATADPNQLLEMIRHLGLGVVRREAMLRYARIWVERPPRREVRYGVKNYPRPGDAADVKAGEEFGPEEEDGDVGGKMVRRGLGSAWEIGHITHGPYAIDSWRIFCRDELLGRGEGKGNCKGGQFQPEWMRVLPLDKELRAYLRWMWMREGWDWDPVTGERDVLSDELRRAVNGGRVGYDDSGQLRIVESEVATVEGANK